jgi:3-hydroxyacyl-CoA dehydrogenase
MANTKSREIRNVALVGTGVIGASWGALCLAHGFNVAAADPGPNAEANLRRYIDAAWKDLTALGLSANASRDRLHFTLDLKQPLAYENRR